MVSSFLSPLQWQHFLNDIISRSLPVFFLSQISLHKSLQHEQRTDERRTLISSVAYSPSCTGSSYKLHTQLQECTGRGALFTFSSLNYTAASLSFCIELSPPHVSHHCPGCVKSATDLMAEIPVAENQPRCWSKERTGEETICCWSCFGTRLLSAE